MIWRVLGLVSLLWLGACNMMEALGNDELNAQADAIIAELASGNQEAVIARMSSANDVNVVRQQMPSVAALVPQMPPPPGVVTGVNSQTSTSGNTYSVSKTYTYADGVMLADFTFIQEAGVWRLHTFNIKTEPFAPGAQPAPGQPAPAQPGGTPGKPAPVA